MKLLVLFLAAVALTASQRENMLLGQTALNARQLAGNLDAFGPQLYISTPIVRRTSQSSGILPPKSNKSQAAAFSFGVLHKRQDPGAPGRGSSPSQSSSRQASSSKASPRKPAFSPGFLNKGFGKDVPEPTKPPVMKMSSRQKPARLLGGIGMRRRFQDLGGQLAGDNPGATAAMGDYEASQRQQAKTKNLGREEAKLARIANKALADTPGSFLARKKFLQHQVASEKYQQGLTDYATAARASGHSSFHSGQPQQAVNQMKKAARADIRNTLQQKYSVALWDKHEYVHSAENSPYIAEMKPERAFNEWLFTNIDKVEYEKSVGQYRSTFARKKKVFEDLSGSSSSEDERDDFKDVARS